MESHGGNVELLGIEDGMAQLRLTGSCDGCAASASTLELAVERELQEAAPDLMGMAVEGAVEQEVTGMPLPMVVGGAEPADARAPASLSDWLPLDGAGELQPGELRGAEVGGERLVVANVEGTLLAYRDACVACGAPLEGRRAERGCPGLPRLRPALLPAPGGPVAGRGAAPAGAGAAAGRPRERRRWRCRRELAASRPAPR